MVLLCLACGTSPLWPQPTADLETRLQQAEGVERIRLISEYLARVDYGDPQRAITLGEEALDYLSSAPDEDEELAITCGLCRAHLKEDDFDASRSLGERCVEQAENQGEKRWLAWGHLWCLGRAFSLDQQPGRGLIHEERAVELYEELGDLEQLAYALTLTGVDLGTLGDVAVAVEYQLRARALFQSLDNREQEARALLRIGNNYFALGDYDRSLDYTQQALEAYRSVGSEKGEASALLNLGAAYAEKGQKQEALKYFEQSLEIKRRLGNSKAVASQLFNLGVVSMELGQLDVALSYLQQAEERFHELGATQELALFAMQRARLDQKRGELIQALASVRKSIAMAEEMGIEERFFDAYRLMAELLGQTENFSAAIEAWRRYDEVKSSFLNTENSRRIAEMEARYQAESQAREIEQLKEKQALQALEVESQRTTRTALVVGFALLLAILALLFNRYRLRTHAAMMAEMIENEKAVSAGLREIDRLKDDFLANTSHELRTPLYGMVGLAESLLDGAAGELSDPARKNLELIVVSGNRLTGLVGNILDSSKLRQGGLELSKEPVDLYALVDIVITLSKPLVEGRPIELVNAVGRDLPAALADANRVQQVLHNLLGNAIKFTERGEVTVEALCEGEQIVVRVRDTGIGIAPEFQEKIFNSFEQAGASIERTYGGTGLGLTISRQLVGLHGGDLWVESELGEGSTFVFTLPLANEQASESPLPSSPTLVVPESLELSVLEPAAVSPEENLPAILTIDDEPVVRQVLRNHLGLHGYRLLSAANGSEALALLSKEKIDLVLLDIMMPQMSGYEVCRRIREHYSLEQLPVIFLSAKTQTSDRIAGFEEGGNDYLSKPIAKQELLKRVETQLELLQANRAQAEELKVLRGLLTICSQCKKIRDKEGEWNPIETYIDQHSEAAYSHGLCMSCAAELYPELGDLRT